MVIAQKIIPLLLYNVSEVGPWLLELFFVKQCLYLNKNKCWVNICATVVVPHVSGCIESAFYPDIFVAHHVSNSIESYI